MRFLIYLLIVSGLSWTVCYQKLQIHRLKSTDNFLIDVQYAKITRLEAQLFSRAQLESKIADLKGTIYRQSRSLAALKRNTPYSSKKLYRDELSKLMRARMAYMGKISKLENAQSMVHYSHGDHRLQKIGKKLWANVPLAPQYK